MSEIDGTNCTRVTVNKHGLLCYVTIKDDEIDKLRRKSFRELLGSEWAHGVEPAVDVALLGRYYERIADHAVSIAERVVFLVTGEGPIA